MRRLKGPRAGQVTLFGVFGVKPDFDRVALGRRALGKGRALRDAELPGHEVPARNGFGHGMLDLEPGVHLEEEHGAVRHQKLHRARALIGHGLCRGYGSGFQLGSHRVAQVWSGSLLQHLLVSPLGRAIPIVEGEGCAVLVRKDLNFHVPSSGEPAF